MADAQLKVRLARDLHSQLVEAAAANGRSLNAEVVARLRRSFDADRIEQACQRIEAAADRLSRAE